MCFRKSEKKAFDLPLCLWVALMGPIGPAVVRGRVAGPAIVPPLKLWTPHEA